MDPTSPTNASPSPPASEADFLHAIGYVQWVENTGGEKSGVTRFDRERVADGINLYTNDVDEVYLMDLDGRRLHTWRVPSSAADRPFHDCEYAELLDDGQLVVVCVDQALVQLDRDSRVVWEFRERVHHDVAVLTNGEFLVPHLVPEVQYQGRIVFFDGISRLSAEGVVLETWSSWEHFDELRALHDSVGLDSLPGPEDHQGKTRYDYYHLNSVEALPDTELGRRDSRFRAGNWLLCLRNANLVVILDRDDQSVVWHWGPGILDFPHMPTMLDNGHLLIYDNGAHRGFSRIVELDPESGEIVWEYRATPREAFLSKRRGANQRLKNGNTLITESDRGRVFEVTRDGEIVWEFWAPEIVDGKRLGIYRLLRLPRSTVRASVWPSSATGE